LKVHVSQRGNGPIEPSARIGNEARFAGEAGDVVKSS